MKKKGVTYKLITRPFKSGMGIQNHFRWVCSLFLVAFILGLFVLTVHAQPVLIALWDFSDLNLIVDNGTGTLIPGPDLMEVNVYHSWSPGGLQKAWAPRNWSLIGVPEAGKHMEFALDLTGYGTITLDFDSSYYPQGPRSWSTEYSIDGTNYFDAGCSGVNPAYPAHATQSCQWAWDSIVGQAIRDRSDVRIRIYGFNAGTTNGILAIDNIQFEATTTPTVIVLSNLSATVNVNFIGFGSLALFLFLTTTILFLKRPETQSQSE